MLALLAGQACQKTDKPAAGIVLTLIDQGWWVDKESRDRLNEELRLFTNESGIRVEVLPAPESAVEQLATWRKLLEGGATVPDVYASRKSVSRDSKEIANASDFAEPLTLSALSLHETRRKIVSS